VLWNSRYEHPRGSPRSHTPLQLEHKVVRDVSHPTDARCCSTKKKKVMCGMQRYDFLISLIIRHLTPAGEVSLLIRIFELYCFSLISDRFMLLSFCSILFRTRLSGFVTKRRPPRQWPPEGPRSVTPSPIAYVHILPIVGWRLAEESKQTFLIGGKRRMNE
jgi:hypothetical protein